MINLWPGTLLVPAVAAILLANPVAASCPRNTSEKLGKAWSREHLSYAETLARAHVRGWAGCEAGDPGDKKSRALCAQAREPTSFDDDLARAEEEGCDWTRVTYEQSPLFYYIGACPRILDAKVDEREWGTYLDGLAAKYSRGEISCEKQLAEKALQGLSARHSEQ